MDAAYEESFRGSIDPLRDKRVRTLIVADSPFMFGTTEGNLYAVRQPNRPVDGALQRVVSLWVRKRGTLRTVPHGATQHKHQLLTTTLSSYWSGVTTFRRSGTSIVAYGQADCNDEKRGGERLLSWLAVGEDHRCLSASF